MTHARAQQIAARNKETVVPTLCGLCGPNRMNCGVYAFVKDGRFVRAAGMAENPANQGALCAKGQAAPQWVYAPERLKYPLKRIGAKGDGKFARIGWDEAVSLLAETLKDQRARYGPESLAVLSPAFRSYNDYWRRFLTVHGSPNYGHSGICAMQRAFAFMYTVGDWPQADIDASDLVIYWAKQPIFSSPALEGPRMLIRAKLRGATIIAIKPSVEPDAGMADIWLPVRPGTDAALALAMLHTVVSEDLIDHEFVARWCYGYERLRAHIQQFPPAWAEVITGVPAEQIVRVARRYATTRKAAIDLGNGVEHCPSSSDAIRAVAILIAVTGHLDRPGGNLFNAPMQGPGVTPRPKPVMLPQRYTQAMRDKLVAPEFPRPFQPFLEGLTSAYFPILESVLTEKPYPVRTIIAPGTQPTVSTRGTQRVLEALKKVDFYVVADVMRTADMHFADLVIPVATPYETDHPFEMCPGRIVPRNKVVEPLGAYKSMYELVLDLAVAMGYGPDFWNGDIQACMDDLLQPLGITMAELRRHPAGIACPPPPRTYENYERVFSRQSLSLSREPFLPHGKVEIYNTSFEAEGYRPLPGWTEPPESLTATPRLRERYPLIFSDYHTSKNYTAAWLRNVPDLREIQPEPVLHIHPQAAAERGIGNGDAVLVQSPHGSMRVRAGFHPGIRPDTVMMLHGWWQGCAALGLDDYPLADGGANVNNLYSVDRQKAYDPLITAMSSQTLVQVTKCAA